MLGFLHYLRSNGGREYLVETSAGAQAFVVEGGMQALARALAQRLRTPVALDSPVTTIVQHTEHVASERAASATLHARRAIVAMAPSAAGRIEITPVATRRQQLGQRIPVGSVIKCLVAYQRLFWREQGLSGELVSNRTPLSPVFDASPADGAHGVPVGFIAGEPALCWSGDKARRRQAVVDGLTQVFGPEAVEPLDYIDYDWTSDPIATAVIPAWRRRARAPSSATRCVRGGPNPLGRRRNRYPMDRLYRRRA